MKTKKTNSGVKPCCPQCKHPGFWQGDAPDGRPSFVCDKCLNYWTCGMSGGEYAGKGMKNGSPSDSVLKVLGHYKLILVREQRRNEQLWA